MYTAEVKVELKKGMLDAEGKTTAGALRQLGFAAVDSVQSIKLFRIELEAGSKEDAEKKVDEMCQRLLANPVINDYSIEIKE